MNFMISILGWFLWNWGELTWRKRQLDNDGDDKTVFTLREYANIKWAFWIGSLAFAPLLIWAGANRLDLKPLESFVGHIPAWSDLYLLASGPAFEMVIFFIEVLHKRLKKTDK